MADTNGEMTKRQAESDLEREGFAYFDLPANFEAAFLLPYYELVGFADPAAVTYAQINAAGWPVYASREDVESVARVIRASPYFNAKTYRALMGPSYRHLDPALHYVLVGERLGMPPSDRFDPVYYLESRPDVDAAAICLLAHYIRYGLAEGRRALPLAAEMATNTSRFDPAKDCIILVSHEASRTGAPILALNIGQRLRAKYNIITVLMRGGGLVKGFEELSAQLICLDDKSRNPVELKYFIDAILGAHNVRYALVNSIVCKDILPILAARFIPTVTLIHEFSQYSRPKAAVREALGCSAEIVFSTALTADSFREEHSSLAQRRLHVLSQGRCNLPAPAASGDGERRRLESAVRPPEAQDSLIVLGLGHVQLRKGVDLFINTAAAVRRLAPGRSMRFVWIGGGYDPSGDLDYSIYLAAQVARLDLADHVVFLDEVGDLGPAYALADIFYLSSRLDPLPNVAIEAASLGLPVVCFEGATGIADLLRRDATATRTIVTHLDTDAAARLIIELGDDEALRKRIGAATRDLAQKAFDMDGYVADIDTIGAEAVSVMRQRRADFETMLDDPDFDLAFTLPGGNRVLPQDVAICHFMSGWSATRTSLDEASCLELLRPCAGFHPQIYAAAHPGLGEINPYADFVRKGRPEGPWLSRVIRGESAPPASTLRTAIQAHFHYPELICDFLGKLEANTSPCDLLLSTNDAQNAKMLKAATARFAGGRVTIRVVPNRGRDIGPLLTAFGGEILRDYDVVGHFHGKRSLAVDSTLGDAWRECLWQHLAGDVHPMMDVVLAEFKHDENLGLVFAGDRHVCGWDANLTQASALAARVGIETPLPPFFDFPVGTMFWARPRALAPLIDLKLDWDDYPDEPLPYDGTILHALERLIPFAARKEGIHVRDCAHSRN